jgi:hypothetical protein
MMRSISNWNINAVIAQKVNKLIISPGVRRQWYRKPADYLFNLTIGRKGYKRMENFDNRIILLRTKNPMGNV